MNYSTGFKNLVKKVTLRSKEYYGEKPPLEKIKYFMVFQSKKVEDTYNAKGIIELMKRL